MEKKCPFTLPTEIFELVLSKLSISNLTNCRLVCKSWNNLVSTYKLINPRNLFFVVVGTSTSSKYLDCVDLDPQHSEGPISRIASFSFHPKHLKGISSLASFRFHSDGSVFILNSCAGLLSLLLIQKLPCNHHLYFSYVICLLNPTTNEYIRISPPQTQPLCSPRLTYRYILGFGPKTKHYKMARISFLRCKSTTFIEVLALGSTTVMSEWTHAGFIPSFVVQSGAYFDGGLYWIGRVMHDTTNVIYRLDIETDGLKRISFPQNGGQHLFLGVMDDTLYVTLCSCRIHFIYHVWKMGQDYSWIKVFDVSEPNKLRHYSMHINPQATRDYCLQPIKTCKDGKILFLFYGYDLIQYDPKTKVVDIIMDQNVTFKKEMEIHRIESFHFNSISNILAGNY